jgi:hypothetical protein
VTIFGVDLSGYQAGVSLRGIRAEGFDFAFCKISEDVSYRSPDWPRQRDEARASGLILAGYHYIRGSSPAGQAANCRSWIGDPSIPVALDLEGGSGDINQYRAVYAAFRAAGLNVALSYIPRWYWQSIGSPSLSGLPPLWASSYPSMRVAPAAELYKAVGASHWSGYGGLPIAVLQFASSAWTQGRAIDANAFQGSREELAALLRTSPTEGAFMALSDAEQREILDGIRKLKPGVVLPARSANCREDADDQYGHVMNGEADAADALAEVRALRTELRAALSRFAPGSGDLTEATLAKIAQVVNDDAARRQAD